jgi:hypothetical protein
LEEFMTDTTQTQGWYVGQWGTFGWLETIAKFAGIVMAFIAFIQSLSTTNLIIGGNPRLATVIVLIPLTLIWTYNLILRFQQREIISMIFGILNALGHAAVLIALLKMPEQRTFAIIFAIAYIIGEVFKRVFLIKTGFTESGRSNAAMMTISNSFIGGYILLLISLII